MVTIDCMGEQCPIPVVKTRKAILGLTSADTVETIVDNEIAVQNLTKMANEMGYRVSSKKVAEGKFAVTMEVSEDALKKTKESAEPSEDACAPDQRAKSTVIQVASDTVGIGEEELGHILMKSFIYSLTQLDTLPTTMLFYNGGAKLTCEGSPVLDDLKSLEAQGVEILTCGTCLDFQHLKEKLAVGSVTNMYEIARRMTQADRLVRP